VPLRAELRAQSLELDVQIANAKVGPWLQRVANQRIHGTTLAVPTERLREEVKQLLPLPRFVQGASHHKSAPDIRIVPPLESINLQHPMNVYEALLGGDYATA